MIHTVEIDDSLRDDLHDAAKASSMTVLDFEAWAITAAVQEYKRRVNGWYELEAALGAAPGGD